MACYQAKLLYLGVIAFKRADARGNNAKNRGALSVLGNRNSEKPLQRFSFTTFFFINDDFTVKTLYIWQILKIAVQ